jgi:hypothetical protein
MGGPHLQGLLERRRQQDVHRLTEANLRGPLVWSGCSALRDRCELDRTRDVLAAGEATQRLSARASAMSEEAGFPLELRDRSYVLTNKQPAREDPRGHEPM